MTYFLLMLFMNCCSAAIANQQHETLLLEFGNLESEMAAQQSELAILQQQFGRQQVAHPESANPLDMNVHHAMLDLQQQLSYFTEQNHCSAKSGTKKVADMQQVMGQLRDMQDVMQQIAIDGSGSKQGNHKTNGGGKLRKRRVREKKYNYVDTDDSDDSEEVKDLNSAVNEMKHQLELMSIELENKTDALKKKKRIVVELREELDTEKRRHQRMQVRNACHLQERDAEIEVLQTKLYTAQQKLDDLEQEKQKLLKKLVAARDNDDYSKEVKQLKSKLKQAEREVKQMEDEKDEEVDRLMGKLNRSNRQLRRLQREA